MYMDQGHHHQQQQQHNIHQTTSYPVGIDYSGAADRFPQWSLVETRELLAVRGELDGAFMETKRNKVLWEEISRRMRDKGFVRSGDQCKSKWKNLVTRYKGCETSDAEGMRQQFAHYNDLQGIFATRRQRMLWLEAEGRGKRKAATTSSAMHQLSSDELEDEDEDEEDKEVKIEKPRKKTRKVRKASTSCNNYTSSDTIMKGTREMMEEFMRQQMEMDMRWMRAYEAREEERRAKEREWREMMEGLEKERMMSERRWREREEERKVREEARSEKRDQLITTLLNKLRREDHI